MGEVGRTGRVSLDIQGTLAELFQLTCVNFHTFTVEMSQPQSDTGDGSLELNNNNNNLFLLTVQGFKLMTSRLRDVQKNEILFSCNRKHSNFSHVRKDDSDPESVYIIVYWQMCFIKYTLIQVTNKPTNQQVDSKSTSLWRIVYSRSGWNSLSWYLYCYIRIKIFISIQYIIRENQMLNYLWIQMNPAWDTLHMFV